MSLVPYHPLEDREIVLRHNNSLVVRDRASHRLELRRATPTECPTCHQPLHHQSPAPERHRGDFDAPDDHDSFVSPNYFRLLQASHNDEYDRDGHYGHPDDDIENVNRDRPHPHPHSRSRSAPEGIPPSSPVRRLVHRVPHVEAEAEIESGQQTEEFISSTPSVQEGGEGSGIRKNAFSHNYFAKFFQEERELGRGGKGIVLLVRHILDGCELGEYACKRVPVGDDHAWLEKVLVEVQLLANLSHPNLVSYRHVWLEEFKLNRFGPPVACAFILQQYCNGGDLLQYVLGPQPKEATNEDLKAQMRRRSKGHSERPQDLAPAQRRLSLEEIYSIFRDITSGLAYLHSANYIHRDLKPSNCLLHREGKNFTCLISDFGEVQQAKATRKSTGSTGTISYCAPEVLIMDSTGRYGNFTTKSDIFSLGMILYFLCFGRLPYQSANAVHEELEDIEMLRAEITHWKGFQDERRERSDLPSKLYHLLKMLLSTNPAERPSATEVLSVMKNESSLDGVPRGPRSSSPPSSLGLSRRRIQNLDSPTNPPSTPVNEPTKHSHVAPSSSLAFRDDHNHRDDGNEDVTRLGPGEVNNSPQPTPQNCLQKHTNPLTPRHRSPLMTTSRSRDSYDRGPASPRPTDRSSPTGSVAVIGPTSPTGAPISRPLLMPPPATPLEQARHQVVVAQHRLSQFLSRNVDSIASSTRLVLFLLKVFSLTRPCWPYVVSSGIGASLVAVAGLDLVMPTSNRGGTALTRGSPRQTAAAGAAVPTGQGVDGAVAARWRWDWRVSVILLVVHFLVLWATFHWGKLCAAAHETSTLANWSHPV